MASLFGGAASSLSAPSTTPRQPRRNRWGVNRRPASPPACGRSRAEAAEDLADYQRLTAEGKLAEAGQKLEELKRALDRLNTRH